MKKLLFLALVAIVLTAGCTTQPQGGDGDKLTGKFTDDQALKQLESEVDQMIAEESLGDIEKELEGLF